MALKDLWKKLSGKPEETASAPAEEVAVTPLASDAFPVVKLSEEQLTSYEKIPLASLAGLGNAFAHLPAGARTITETTQIPLAAGQKLYIGWNPKNVPGYIQKNAFGETGNIMQINPQGKHVIAGRKGYFEIGNEIPHTTTLPLDPTLMLVAVALASIDQKLDNIQKSVREALQFLKQDKQSEQRGHLNALAEMMGDYKRCCQDEQFCTTRAGEVLSIKTAAFQNIDFYYNQAYAELQKQKALHGAKDAQSLLDALAYQLAEYQLACHIYAYASFLDILLRRDFAADAIKATTDKITEIAKRYEALYAECYAQISKYQRSTVEAKLLEGLGAATKGLGKAIGAIPLIKDGTVDETLISAGDSIGNHNQKVIAQRLKAFEIFEDSRTGSLVESLQMTGLLYNTENAMVTDGTDLYVLKA